MAGNVWTTSLDVFLIGTSGALGLVIQMRLMVVAGKAQALAASLNHSTFNTANALGPLLAGWTMARGPGFRSTGLVGAGFAVAGFAIRAAPYAMDRRTTRRAGLAAPGDTR